MINWDLAVNRSNPFAEALQGYQVGQKMGRDLSQQQALKTFGTDPAAGVAAMAQTDPIAAASLAEFGDKSEARAARTKVKPLVEEGKYGEAAQALATTNPELAGHLMQMDANSRKLAHERAERGASVLTASMAFKDPEERRAFVAKNAADIYSPEQLQGFDFTNDQALAAEAYKSMGLADLAGKVDMQQVGDKLVTYRTGPMGVQKLGSEDIPETRKEKAARENLEADNTRQAQRDAENREHQRTMEGFQAQQVGISRARLGVTQANSSAATPSRVVGSIYAKMAAGQQITPGEQQVLDAYSKNSLAGLLGGLDGGQQPAPAQPLPGGAGRGGRGGAAPAAPKAASTTPPADMLFEGRQSKLIGPDGKPQIWTKENGQPRRLR